MIYACETLTANMYITNYVKMLANWLIIAVEDGTFI